MKTKLLAIIGMVALALAGQDKPPFVEAPQAISSQSYFSAYANTCQSIMMIDTDGSTAFKVDCHGTITLKDGATPDESAKAFITAVKKLWPTICVAPESPSPK